MKEKYNKTILKCFRLQHARLIIIKSLRFPCRMSLALFQIRSMKRLDQSKFIKRFHYVNKHVLPNSFLIETIANMIFEYICMIIIYYFMSFSRTSSGKIDLSFLSYSLRNRKQEYVEKMIGFRPNKSVMDYPFILKKM